jgi:DNA invertase Pin-like site-specific DNA recombinase
MIVAEVIIREFQKVGVKVISASGGMDLTEGNDANPTAKLIRQILAAVAEFDRCVIVLKLRGARQRIRKEGRRPGAKNYSTDPVLNQTAEGRKPFGQKDGEKPILDRMIALKSEGQNPQQIAHILNSEGVPTRYGKQWCAPTVAKILKRN